MKLAGILNEPPLDPVSWSGTALHFFGALDRAGILAGTVDATMSGAADWAFRAVNVSLPLEKWRESYHLDVRRFKLSTQLAARRLARSRISADGILQIGAWYCLPDAVSLPCYSYHDGNLAVRVRAGHIGMRPEHPRVRQAMQWEYETYSKLEGIFVMSSWLAGSFVKDFRVPSRKVHVVGAGINFNSIPTDMPRTISRPSFLMVGKDFERKDGRILLAAFEKVRREVPDAELVLVGPELENLPPGVRTLGFLSKRNPEDVLKLEEAYRRAGIYVLPSLYEPFGISLLEAMAYSLPCIAANHCAMPEIVEDGVTGLVVDPGDVDSLAAAMMHLAKCPSMALEMGTAGRARLLQKHTWDAVAAKIRDAVA